MFSFFSAACSPNTFDEKKHSLLKNPKKLWKWSVIMEFSSQFSVFYMAELPVVLSSVCFWGNLVADSTEKLWDRERDSSWDLFKGPLLRKATTTTATSTATEYESFGATFLSKRHNRRLDKRRELRGTSRLSWAAAEYRAGKLPSKQARKSLLATSESSKEIGKPEVWSNDGAVSLSEAQSLRVMVSRFPWHEERGNEAKWRHWWSDTR